MKHDRKIKILCDGGLGNRIAGLLGGLITADRLGLEPLISWPQNNWCGAAFDDLFEPNGLLFDGQGVHDLMRSDSDDIFLLHENQTGVLLKTQMSHGRHSELVIQTRTANVVFYTARVPEHLPMADVLRKIQQILPRHKLLTRINKFCGAHDITKNTMGLHLRKTDQMHLDEEWWYDYVQHKGANKRYFVCSDDRDTQQRFAALPNVVAYPKTHYVEKLIEGPWRQARIQDRDGRVFPNNIDRGRESVIQAWMDLLILSRTTILHTVKSSFSQTASWIAQSRGSC